MWYNIQKQQGAKMTITLKIENTDIEEQLKAFIQEQKEVTIEALTKFLNSFQKKERLKYKKKDIYKHLSVITSDDDEPRDESIKLYSHVEDSAKYIHDLRRVRNR